MAVWSNWKKKKNIFRSLLAPYSLFQPPTVFFFFFFLPVLAATHFLPAAGGSHSPHQTSPSHSSSQHRWRIGTESWILQNVCFFFFIPKHPFYKWTIKNLFFGINLFTCFHKAYFLFQLCLLAFCRIIYHSTGSAEVCQLLTVQHIKMPRMHFLEHPQKALATCLFYQPSKRPSTVLQDQVTFDRSGLFTSWFLNQLVAYSY